jgi:hypothetical protein
MDEASLEAVFSKIDQSDEIFQLYEGGLLPPNNFGDEYFFISYSHEDFRFVYKDIFSLQEQQIQVWYDRGMTPGRDWDETAEHFDTVCVSAGKVGAQVELSPQDLIRAAELTTADLVTDDRDA